MYNNNVVSDSQSIVAIFQRSLDEAKSVKMRFISGEISEDTVIKMATTYVDTSSFSAWLDVFYTNTELLRKLTLLWIENHVTSLK